MIWQIVMLSNVAFVNNISITRELNKPNPCMGLHELGVVPERVDLFTVAAALFSAPCNVAKEEFGVHLQI